MSAAAMTWAISPPMMPAPTTAALNTNMGLDPLAAVLRPKLSRSPRRGSLAEAARAVRGAARRAAARADEEQVDERARSGAGSLSSYSSDERRPPTPSSTRRRRRRCCVPVSARPRPRASGPRRGSWAVTRSTTRPRPAGVESQTRRAPGVRPSVLERDARARSRRPTTAQRVGSYQSASASTARPGTHDWTRRLAHGGAQPSPRADGPRDRPRASASSAAVEHRRPAGRTRRARPGRSRRSAARGCSGCLPAARQQPAAPPSGAAAGTSCSGSPRSAPASASSARWFRWGAPEQAGTSVGTGAVHRAVAGPRAGRAGPPSAVALGARRAHRLHSRAGRPRPSPRAGTSDGRARASACSRPQVVARTARRSRRRGR